MCHCKGRNRCALGKDSYGEVRNEFPVIWMPLAPCHSWELSRHGGCPAVAKGWGQVPVCLLGSSRGTSALSLPHTLNEAENV